MCYDGLFVEFISGDLMPQYATTPGNVKPWKKVSLEIPRVARGRPAP